MWKEWQSKFTAALDSTAPIVHRPCRRKRHRCPWMTPDLLRILHRQKFMYRRVIGSDHQDNAAVHEHRRLRNLFRNTYRQLKNEHFSNRLREYRTSPRKFWNTINLITGRQRPGLPPTINLSDLAVHFQSVLTTSPDNNASLKIPFGPHNINDFCAFGLVSEETVQQLLNKLVPGKATGPDGIGPTELKLSAPLIASSLAALFNASLSSGEIPSDFKTANIVPLLKPGKSSSSLPENYRGISLLPVISKLLERIVHDEVSAFLERNGALNPQQFGFRKNHSCADLLLSITDDILVARDQKKYTVAVMIDLSKAFDSIPHQELIFCLQRTGIGGIALKWFKNYLADRQHRVVSNFHSSSSFSSNRGVPQGSVLGPLLFNLYVSSLPRIAEHFGAKLPSFADDMTLYASSSSLSSVCDVVNASLQAVANKLDEQGLKVNAEKTVAMIFSPWKSNESTTDPPRILLRNVAINFSSSARLLGVIIDDSLSWLPHVEHLQKKTSRKIGVLRRTSRQLSLNARRQFFLSVIQPDFEYASNSTIPFMSSTLRNRILTLWRRAVRCAAGSTESGTFDLQATLKHLRITPISHRWTLTAVLTVRRCVLDSAPPPMSGRLNKLRHHKPTRSRAQGGLLPMRPQSLIGTRSFSNRGPLLWNAIPSDIRSTPSLSKFKSEMTRLISSPSNIFTRLALDATDL